MLKREQIKDRMMKTAARLWEIPEGEIETNFDPLVTLLLEACASELEGIGASMNATQARLLDKLAELILPEAMINARPASCIIQASPIEAVATVNESTRFFTSQRMSLPDGKAANQDFYFTPVGKFSLLKCNLGYIKAGGRYFAITGSGQKEPVFDEGGQQVSNEIWLALTPDKLLSSLKGLQFFFDLKGHSDASLFYNSLHNAKAYINGQEVTLGNGYFGAEQFDLNLEEALGKGHDYSKKIHRQTAGIYQNRFLHLAADHKIADTTNIPEEWTTLPEKNRKEWKEEPVILVKIELGRYFPQDTLDRVFCSINAFPAVNRKLNTMNYRTDAWVNIIPMQIEGSFLDLDAIEGVTGGHYKINSSANTADMKEGEAIVRNSGVGKTSSVEVREIIGSLMEAIRDESAYFSKMSNEFVLARLREISRILARLEDQMAGAKDKKELLHYLLLKPGAAGESVTIRYWTTNGAGAHQVKTGTALTAFNHTLTHAKGVIVLTNPVGGKSIISEAEKKYLLQRQLSSGGKVISAEDVKLLSFQLFGDLLKSVEVKKAIQPGSSPKDGFLRTIDVLLTLHPRVADSRKEETDYLCRELEYNLSQNASPIYPFRIVIL